MFYFIGHPKSLNLWFLRWIAEPIEEPSTWFIWSEKKLFAPKTEQKCFDGSEKNIPGSILKWLSPTHPLHHLRHLRISFENPLAATFSSQWYLVKSLNALKRTSNLFFKRCSFRFSEGDKNSLSRTSEPFIQNNPKHHFNSNGFWRSCSHEP